MLELLWSTPFPVSLATLLVCMLLLALPPMVPRKLRSQPAARHSYTLGHRLVVSCTLPLMLFGCGTAPSPVLTFPPVPAELMADPQAPVLLTPSSRSMTPGATRPRTPSGAASTGSD